MAATYPTAPAPRAGLGPNVKHNPRNPCPICGNGTSYCITFLDGATICGKTPSDHPAGLGYMHWPNGRPDNWRGQLAAHPKPPPRRIADADLSHRAYSALLQRCALSPKHQHDLRQRRMSDEQITRHGYVSPPASEVARRALAADVAAELGQDPAGRVPGFVRDWQGRLDLVCHEGELFIPVRDAHQRGAGIRRRLDNSSDGRKYLWLSAPEGKHSIGQDGNTVHVARLATLRTDRVVIVEGEIKANITADYFGCIVLSVPGVGNINRVTATLAALNAREVAIAYDKDTKPKTIENVAAAETRLAHLLIDAGYQVAQWTWNAEDAKGIDDLLTAGLWPFPIPHPALTAKRDATPSADTTTVRTIESLRFMNQAQARIRRNTRLPARPMAAVLTGVFAQAATASAPAGDYQGRVPPGFVYAPVRALGAEAGTQSGNAGKQIRDLETAGFLKRKTLKEIIPAGQANPDTGQILEAPLVYSKTFLAIAGREHEPIAPDTVREFVDRLATYNPDVPEKRGGNRRIPRCAKHPEAEVLKDWVAYCSICHGELARGDAEPVPAMLLEPLNEPENGAESPDDQSLITRETANDAPPASSSLPLVVRDSLGIRPIAHEVRQRAVAAVDQSLVVRRQRAYANLSELTDWTPPDEPDPSDDDAGEPPPLTLFPLPEPGCVDCDAVIAEGQTYCRACDPRTA